MIERVPDNVLVVLDEAYTEYLPEAIKSDSVGWLKRFPNLIVTRTFSKAYGLAGLRVGYALASPQVADMLNRVRQPFNVNALPRRRQWRRCRTMLFSTSACRSTARAWRS